MNALEEIKKPEHERIWLEPTGAPDRFWCQDNQWGDEGVEYVLASTLESLQRENETVDALECALQTAVARAEAAEAEVKRLKEIIGKVAPAERSKSWLPIKDWEDCRKAITSTGGEHAD